MVDFSFAVNHVVHLQAILHFRIEPSFVHLVICPTGMFHEILRDFVFFVSFTSVQLEAMSSLVDSVAQFESRMREVGFPRLCGPDQTS